MAITDKTIKLLWSNAAGICSFTDCDERLTGANPAPYTLGEMAHIKGKKPSSNRYDKAQSDTERDSYENLILLCPTHHELIDKRENEAIYTVEYLHAMKVKHEDKINRWNFPKYDSLEQLREQLAIYIAENNISWEQYGPASDIARRNPNNDEFYNLWNFEKLSTIVPNNRKILKLLNENRNLFSRADQRVVSKFLKHVESYEKWINDEIPYEAVLRFPKEFEQLILGD
ncbi:HNH endonuclease [Legionella tunisiensis]|uniref:HNH endonuclease n=1 Tax=Legionella tunisiensis TaxID=1034944 RepID=UPI00030AF818|nr:HNH endonuclease [Legionella tunisiensis]